MMRNYFLPGLTFLAGMLLAGFIGFLLFDSSEPLLDWTPPQKEAAILLSDPQLYSREALINDRRQEAEFLREMLKTSSQTASSPVEFHPQLQQVLETARTLRAQMNLPDILALPSQNKATAGAGQQETGPPAPESGTRGTGAPDSHSEGTGPHKNASGTRESVLPSPKGEEKRGQRDASLDDPRERFLDLQSYRADIRAALAAVNLDDRHDFGGQALYRLQFRATVLPGLSPAKFGVAEVRVRPPDLQDEDYRRIYLAWLGYATQGLNFPQQVGSIDTDPRYEALSQGSEVIKVLNICHERDQKDCTLSLALPPQGAKSVAKFLESYLDMQNDIKQVQTESPRTGGAPESDDSSQASEEAEITPDPCEQKAAEQNGIPSLLKYYSTTKQVYAILPYIATSLASLKSYQSASQRSQQTQKRYQSASQNSQQAQEPPPESPPDSFSDYFINVDNLSSADSFLLNYFSILERQFPHECDKKKVMLSVSTKRKNTPAPQQFRKKLKELLSEQRPYVYAMTPTELTQRVSNVRSAVTTLDIAVSLANPKVEAGGSKEAKRTIEAIERFPRIVGFADREPDTPSPDMPHMASFGWVFGPRLQSSPNRLEHLVADYNVSVDVAVPGWWPRIELELRTVWVANWHSTSHVLQDTPSRKITVPMPLLTPPDLESLTEVLTRKLIGPWGQPPPPASVSQVNPTAVSACMNEVTFVIEGHNLWRDPEVYWEGVRAENVTLLPGMRGITAAFQIKKLFDAQQVDLQRQQFRRTSLIIALRNSKAQAFPIDFYGHRLGTNHEQCEGPTVSAQGYDRDAPTIHRVAPSTIYACSVSRSLQFFISGTNLGSFNGTQGEATPGRVLFGTTEGTPTVLQSDAPFVAMIVASFPDLEQLLQNLRRKGRELRTTAMAA